MKRSIWCLLMAVLLLIGCAAPAEKITLLSEYEGGTVPINDKAVADYLELPFDSSLSFLKENAYQRTGEAHDSQNVILSWEGGDAPYTISISEHPDLTDAQVWTSSRKNLQTGIFYPDESQKETIMQVYRQEEKKAGQKLAVAVEPLRNFFSAEEYHQKYLEKNPGGYCHIPAKYYTLG